MNAPSGSRRFVRLFGLVLVLGFGAVVGLTLFSKGISADAVAQSAPDGEKVYLTRCMSCHQMNGAGVANVFPPLDGSEWSTGDKGLFVRIILHGLTGPIEVKGVQYAGAMPPWGSFMTDEEIAAVATYVRSSWSNDVDAITTEEVAAVRAATADRKAPYTAEELADPANHGIPQ